MTDGKEVLLEYGHKRKSTSTDLEWEAAWKALEYARWLNVSVVYGDYKACLNKMQKLHPDIEWRWVRSRGNVADKYTKYFPELENRWHTQAKTRGTATNVSL
ncbi:MAG: hypothetical protein LC687_05850 [Actinobacteria bacterium]|nr:hypothetical protein [Actinomycetota bacterium]